jgi:hypothetical protein
MVKTHDSARGRNLGGATRQAPEPTVESFAMARACAKASLVTWALALLLMSVEARAEPFDPYSDDWEGYGDFVSIARAKLGDAFVVESSLNFDEMRREDALVVVYPTVRLDIDDLSTFMSAGGRVALLDDFGTGEVLLRRHGIKRVPSPLRPEEDLRNNPGLAIADPVGPHELALGITRIVTNHATGLEETSLTRFLEIPSLDGPPIVVALVASVSQGGLVVISDPSAVMNSMLRYPGNKRLAENLIAWSSHGRDGKRSGRLFFVHGSFREAGSFGSSFQIAQATRDARAAAALWGPLTLGTREAHVVAAAVGLLVVIWIGSRAGRTYRIVKPRLTRPVPLSLQGGSAGRAAALASRKANRGRALLEIGKALEEDLGLALGLDRIPAHDDAIRRLEAAKLLDKSSLAALRRFLSRAAQIDTLTSAGRSEAVGRVRDADILNAAKVMNDVLEKVQADARKGRAA